MSDMIENPAETLYGTWRLLSFGKRFTASGEKIDSFGKRPRGFLSYARDGRMSAIIASDGRPRHAPTAELSYAQRAELFDTIYAYGGTFSFNGNTVTHHVDISWNESWNGTDQVRRVKLEGDKLYISTEPVADEGDGRQFVWELIWERVPSAV